MIPLGLVTGFLGSGKTTFLRQRLERAGDRRLAFIINELEAADVDGRLLDVPPDRLVTIPGGSIFCRCLSGEFMRHLETLAEHVRTSGDPVEGVIVEASGMADPRIAREMFAETGLAETFDLRCTIAVIDPGSFLKVMHTLPNAVGQVEAAGVVLVNKIDLYEDAMVARAEAEVVRINPTAEVIRCVRANADVDILAATRLPDVHGEYARGRDLRFVSTTVELNEQIDLGELRTLLEAAQGDLYRVKGFVLTTAGPLYVDLSASGVTLEPMGRTAEGDGYLVLIAPAEHAETFHTLAAKLRPGSLPIVG